jgi:hypothetical protein
MKIYINHFNLDILSELIKNLTEYHVKTEEYIQLYSTTGIYMVNNGSTIKLNPIDHDIKVLEKFHDSFTLIVDPSYYIAEKVTQIPPEHINTRVKRYVFALKKNQPQTHIRNKKLCINLIIETEIQTEQDDAFYFLKKNKTDNADLYKDIFFEMPNDTDVNDALVKEEIIEFLSLLN